MVDFYPVRTEDGTLSLFNTKINDIYHSKIGAYTEALNKFTLPSGIVEYAKNSSSISILDVCFGLGYNTRVAINEIWKVNPNCKIHVTGIEIDPYVIACAYFAGFADENILSRRVFKRLILSNPLTRSALLKIYKDVNFNIINTLNNTPFLKSSFESSTKYNVTSSKQGSLHNIYYRSVSNRNNDKLKLSYYSKLLDITLYLGDARLILTSLIEPYNFILHDPFTPSVAPSLWSVDLFKELFRLLDCNGNLTTYTSSAAVRSGMMEAGFYIGKTNPVGRKSSGTIAYKDSMLITTQLDKNEQCLLDTNAGIPYYDKELKHTDSEILENRNNIVKQSSRISTSKYLMSIE